MNFSQLDHDHALGKYKWSNLISCQVHQSQVGGAVRYGFSPATQDPCVLFGKMPVPGCLDKKHMQFGQRDSSCMIPSAEART